MQPGSSIGIADALRKIDDLTERLQIAEEDTVAVVAGHFYRLPGGVNDPGAVPGGCCATVPTVWVRVLKTVEASRILFWRAARPGTMCTRWRQFLTSWQPDEFDAEFFGISPRKPPGWIPQQRLLMRRSPGGGAGERGVTATANPAVADRPCSSAHHHRLASRSLLYEKGGPEDVNPLHHLSATPPTSRRAGCRTSWARRVPRWWWITACSVGRW